MYIINIKSISLETALSAAPLLRLSAGNIFVGVTRPLLYSGDIQFYKFFFLKSLGYAEYETARLLTETIISPQIDVVLKLEP